MAWSSGSNSLACLSLLQTIGSRRFSSQHTLMWTRRRQGVIALICLSAFLYLLAVLPTDLRGHIKEYGPTRWRQDSDANSKPPPPPPPPLPENSPPDTSISETTLPGAEHVPGFTIFDRLYVWNGTLYAVTLNPKAFPDLRTVISQPKDRLNGVNIDPTPQVRIFHLPNISLAHSMLGHANNPPRGCEAILG